jgi:hypothetical protein
MPELTNAVVLPWDVRSQTLNGEVRSAVFPRKDSEAILLVVS